MIFEEIEKIIPVAAPRTKMRKEAFGGMLISGNLPIFRINEDAVAVWELCNGKRSIGEIARLLEEVYEKDGLISRLEEYFTFYLENGILLDAKSPTESIE